MKTGTKGNLKRIAGVSGGAAIALAAPAAAQGASTFTVNTTDDTTNGSCATTCTLRDAIIGANADAGSTINFQSTLSGTITLTSALDTITKTTTVDGPGAKQLAISGDDLYRIFSATGATTSLNVDDLTLTHGSAGYGGAIRVAGGARVNLDRSEITASHATSAGGAIAVDVGYSGGRVTNSTISGNSATGIGGGIWATYAGVTLVNVTMTGNQTSGVGGAIGINDDVDPAGPNPVTIKNSTISGNSAAMGFGGVYIDAQGVATATSSIVYGNTPGAYPAAQWGAVNSIVPAAVVGSPVAQNLTGNPQLGPLQDNGGPTRTMLPAFNGAGIDKGSADPSDATVDQRGLDRVFDVPFVTNAAPAVGAGADIGAVELTLGEATGPPPPPPPPAKTFDLTSALKKCKKKKSKKAKKKCKKKARKRAKAAAAAGATIV